MSLSIYNTLSNQKEKFTPINENEVKMYVCGPTVYNFLHIGNFRGAIFFNLVRNWLEHLGHKVTYVYNYTDVDDKIIKKANEENVDSLVISERYIEEFEKDFNRLNLKKHEYNPKVTEYISDIIQFVDDLVQSKKAYVIDGEVFFEIKTFPTYGKLSGKNLDDLVAGQRVDVDTRKKNPADFVLWKPSKEGEPRWDSPWGKGRPGWHIECSAMIQKILGDTIDIHGGGIDLIFPHHENEIAQGEGRTGKCYCNTWMHNDFLNLNDEKMSKSLGNTVTARAFMDKYHPEILKYLMLSHHYRALFNLNEEKINQCISGLARIYSSLKDAQGFIADNSLMGDEDNHSFNDLLIKHDSKIIESMNDDFNTVEVMASIFEVIRSYNALDLKKKKNTRFSKNTSKVFVEWISKYGQMMSLFQEVPEIFLNQLDDMLIKLQNIDVDLVEELMEKRKEARENKDYEKSDEIRDELGKMGINVNDGIIGRGWEIKK